MSIQSWTQPEEQNYIANAAREANGGLIVEIGALYGGTTAILAKNAPKSTVVTIDNFSWSPLKEMKASALTLAMNLHELDIHNVVVIENESAKVGVAWMAPIKLLWIDGGHSYQYVRSDLVQFGRFAELIACHDYRGNGWDGDVGRAVDEYIAQGAFRLNKVVGSIAELRRA